MTGDGTEREGSRAECSGALPPPSQPADRQDGPVNVRWPRLHDFARPVGSLMHRRRIQLVWSMQCRCRGWRCARRAPSSTIADIGQCRKGRQPVIVVFRSLAAAATRLATSTALFASLLAAAPALSASSDDIDYGGEWMPYEAFDVLPLTEVRSGDSIIEVAFAPGESRHRQVAVARLGRAIGESGGDVLRFVSGRAPQTAGGAARWRPGDGWPDVRPPRHRGTHLCRQGSDASSARSTTGCWSTR